MTNTVLRRRPSVSMIVSMLALSIALGGTGYAASQLPAKSVGTKQLKTGAVTSAKVADKSLKAGDFAPGQLPAGPQGPSDGWFVQGAVAVTLPQTFVEVAGADLPAGSYLVSGSTGLVDLMSPDGIARCAIRAGAVAPTVFHSAVIGKNPATEDGEGVVTVGVDAGVVLTQTTRVSLVCKTEGNLGNPSPAYAEHGQLTAIKVAALH
jgi:hypothetical protein